MDTAKGGWLFEMKRSSFLATIAGVLTAPFVKKPDWKKANPILMVNDEMSKTVTFNKKAYYELLHSDWVLTPNKIRDLES